MAQARAFEKRDAPAVGMVVGPPTPLREAGEAEGHVGRRVAVHAEALAHGERLAFGLVGGLRAGTRFADAGTPDCGNRHPGQQLGAEIDAGAPARPRWVAGLARPLHRAAVRLTAERAMGGRQ